MLKIINKSVTKDRLAYYHLESLLNKNIKL